jgi:uncharacterized membrane protein
VRPWFFILLLVLQVALVVSAEYNFFAVLSGVSIGALAIATLVLFLRGGGDEESSESH